MAIGIVTRAAKQNVGGPGTAGLANIGVITSAAKAPQIFAGAPSIDAELVGLPPDIMQTQFAYVTSRIGRSRERRATLDCPIGFDAESVFPGVATGPMD